MPEAPDLYVIRDYLEANLTGLTITKAEVLRPIVLRSLAVSPEDLPDDMVGRHRLHGKQVIVAIFEQNPGNDARRQYRLQDC